MIEWDKYFDHIYVLSRCSNFQQRENLKKEFERVNLNSYKFWYNCDNLFISNEKFYDYITLKNKRCTFGHYSILKTCYELGYDDVLIFEDDARFLKDINEVKHQLDIFQQYKNDVNIYYFDYNILNEMIFTTTCWYFNKKGMEYMIYMCENNSLQIDNYIFDFFLNPNTEMPTYEQLFIYNDHDKKDLYDINFPPHIKKLNVRISPTRICIQSPVDRIYFLTMSKDEIYNLYNI